MHSDKEVAMTLRTARQLLADRGIKTTADLDRYRGDESRYGALKSLVGETAAAWMLNDLAIQQCC